MKKIKDRSPELLMVIIAAGGVRAISRHLKLSRQAVYQWTEVPLKHAASVANLCNMDLREVRPDLFAAQNDENPFA